MSDKMLEEAQEAYRQALHQQAEAKAAGDREEMERATALVREEREYYNHANRTRSARYINNMLELAKTHRATILQSSTSEIYGEPLVHPQTENYRGNVNPIGIRACYDEGKRCAESLFFDYYRHEGVDIKVIRIFNTYGPNMDPHDGRVVSNFICQALRGEDITIYGDGHQTRSFCYVDDLIEAMVRMMNSPKDFQGPVNTGNPGEFTIRELAEKVVAQTGSHSKIVYKDLPADDPTQRRPDISLAKNKLGWEPSVSLDEGLQKTIDYFKREIAHPALAAE